jgi:uncharacterized ferredoxin-like protein
MKEFEKGIKQAAELMAISARTAPKAKGEDFIEVKILSGKQIERLGKAMLEHGRKEREPMWKRDAKCILESTAILLVGVRDPVKELKGRGKSKSKDLAGDDPFAQSERVRRYVDLGIALGSAAKTASILNIDNRIMWRAGEMARRLGMMKTMMVISIPLSAYGKNIYFDR